MSELLDHVARNIATRRLFQPGQRILVGVSGGVDSMVLWHLLHALAPQHGWQVTAAHLNHQLRGRSSTADERLVRRTAQKLKSPVVVARADVRRLARAQKLSLEMAARELRHGFLARTARRRRIPSIALAHHADDQLELFFLRLLRGSGGEGLAGMKWRNPSPSDNALELVHPLLDQPKADLIAYATKHGIAHREDASNAVLDFQRNRVRHELLPLLRRKYQPALDRIVPRVMEIVGAEAEFAAETAREWLEGARSPKSGEGGAALGRRGGGRPGKAAGLPFEELPVAVQRRCVQLQLMSQGVAADFELVEELRLVADRPIAVGRVQAQADVRRLTGASQAPMDTPTVRRMGARGLQMRTAAPVGRVPSRGVWGRGITGLGKTSGPLCAVRDRLGLVHLQAAEAEEFKPGAVAVALKGRAGGVEFDGVSICWRRHSRGAVERPKAGVGREWFDADKVGARVWLRHWRPGDRFQPIGMAAQVKLQDFFTNLKVPRDLRRWLLVAATAKEEIFWVEGMRISERFKLTPATIHCLQWGWKRL